MDNDLRRIAGYHDLNVSHDAVVYSKGIMKCIILEILNASVIEDSNRITPALYKMLYGIILN